MGKEIAQGKRKTKTSGSSGSSASNQSVPLSALLQRTKVKKNSSNSKSNNVNKQIKKGNDERNDKEESKQLDSMVDQNHDNDNDTMLMDGNQKGNQNQNKIKNKEQSTIVTEDKYKDHSHHKNNNNIEEEGEEEEEQEQILVNFENLSNEIKLLRGEQKSKMNKIYNEYNRRLVPYYNRRQDDLITNLPEFWLKVLLAHPEIGEHISDLDQEVLEYCTKIWVSHFSPTKYQIEFHFDAELNPFFENDFLWKIFDEELESVEVSPIDYKNTKQGQDLKGSTVTELIKKHEETEDYPDITPSFLSIFHEDDRDFHMGELFKKTIFPDAFDIYSSVDFDEEDVDGKDEEDGKR